MQALQTKSTLTFPVNHLTKKSQQSEPPLMQHYTQLNTTSRQLLRKNIKERTQPHNTTSTNTTDKQHSHATIKQTNKQNIKQCKHYKQN